MADISSAATMVNYYTDHPPQIRGRTVYVQFSNHEELKTEQSSQVRNVLSYITHPCRLFSMADPRFESWEMASLAILKISPSQVNEIPQIHSQAHYWSAMADPIFE